MVASIDISHCTKDDHIQSTESPAIARPSVKESEVFPKVIPRLDSDIVLTHTSDTKRKRLVDDGIGPSMEDIEGYSSGSGSEDNKNAGPKQHGVTERRRAQNAKFNSWLVTPNSQNSINTSTELTTQAGNPR